MVTLLFTNQGLVFESRLRLKSRAPVIMEVGEDGVPPQICYLAVPVNKNKPEFRKPVSGEVGEAIEAWLAVRPESAGNRRPTGPAPGR